MIKTILDTNVFVSGIFWSGPPSKILDAWQERKLDLVTSQPIIEEYARVCNVLAKKYKVDISPFIDRVIINSEIHKPVALKQPVSQDPDDDKFIECALSAKCKLIVSGDKDLLEVSGYADISVLKPPEFVKKHLKKTK